MTTSDPSGTPSPPQTAAQAAIEAARRAAADNGEDTWLPDRDGAESSFFADVDAPVRPQGRTDEAAPAPGGPNVEAASEPAGRAREAAAGVETVAPHLVDIWGSDFEGADPGATVKSAHFRRERIPIAREAPPLPDEAVVGYDFLRVLGEGGVGVVYEATQKSVERNIAVKMIRHEHGGDRREREKFLAEAVVTGRLDHPNIVPIHDVGATESGKPFYVMKMVKGTRWNDVIRQRSLAENLDTLLDVCDAVAYAHSKGVIHRDIKPENVMLGEFGEVQVMDWGLGLAVNADGDVEEGHSDVAGGTPAYMAPEMVTGDQAPVGVASDVYLLGGTLYEVVTGLRPHGGKRVLECLENAHHNRIQPTEQRGVLVDIALRAMATAPQDRYASVRDLKAAILDYQNNAESINLTARGMADLEQAEQAQDYERFNQAIFAFREALAMWSENVAAREQIVAAQASLARCAVQKADLDLAASVLDPDEPAHAGLRREVAAAQRRRALARRRLRNVRIFAIGATVATLVILATASIVIARARDQAVQAKEAAVLAQQAEAEQRRIAEIASAKARAEEQRAVAAKEELEDAIQAMVQARSDEERAKATAQAAVVMAEQAQDKLARTGMLLDASWWVFDAAAARQRQQAAATVDQPVERTVRLPGGVSLGLVLIPPGEFVMGSPPSETQRAADEYLHRVRHVRPFYLAATELTEAQWAAVVGSAPACAAGRDVAEELPVVGVTYEAVVNELLPALQQWAPRGYRFVLPTEAQWEYACRAGSAAAFHSGDSEAALQSVGWYVSNSERRVHAVAEKQPNAFGLYDMHGNVGELCRDTYDANYYLRAPREDPVCDTNADQRVVRGGSVLNTPRHTRSAYRSYIYRKNHYDFVGLRLALVPDDD